MIKQSILLVIGFACILSCKRKDDHSSTKVGFYVADASATENVTYNLFMDNAFMGKIHALDHDPVCGDPLLLYITIDGKRHEMEVKDDAGKLLNSEYLQASEHKCGSGSGKNSKNVSGAHGSNYSQKAGADCATMGFTK